MRSSYNVVPSCRLVWDRRGLSASSADAVCSVELEVTYRNQRKWKATGVKVAGKYWDPIRQRVIKKGDLVQLNERLSTYTYRVECLFAELLRQGREFEFWMVSDVLAGKKPVQVVEVDDVDRWLDVDALEWMEDRIKERKDLREGTLKTHQSMVECIRRYNDFCKDEAGWREKRIRVFGDLKKSNIVSWDKWLHDHNNYTQSSIYGYHKRLKRYINEAKVMDMIKENPYNAIKVKRGRTEGIRYLSEEEIEKLRGLDLGDRVYLKKVRDMFLFQCYTGLAYADMARFSMDRCEKRDGRLWLKDDRVKSGETYWLLIMKPAMEILERWGGILPVMTNQKYNMFLKVLEELAGFSINLTSHVARHTFGVMAINNGINIEIVAKMMGHTQIQTTQLYAKILGKSVEDAFLNLEGKL